MKLFTKEGIKLLLKNKCGKNVIAEGITYTDEFMKIFICEYDSGQFPRRIFKEYGIDVYIRNVQGLFCCEFMEKFV